ncbi:ScpA family protein [Brasilonema sp. UFV-L1]|uniref:segregation/condensation protein A n=1 Tax=Brasilonema sp. UFV-L1 TaxID=2234130 RepID=UPI00145D91CF|nr:ScpA family protein [Brasilonema sp. UFV-L1]NMG10167.1 segregation/condensation protein A [Brasilonema sp. UFV-L1]
MDASELLEKITLLIHQAEQGEIDPWDVKVIEVIDRYLELMVPSATTKGYETDLFQSGQAFLSASRLVLFKANTLMQLQSSAQEQEAVEDILSESEDGIIYHAQRLPLERHLRRRPTAMPPSKRRVTLQELIEQLQVMAQQLKLVEKVNKPVRQKRQPSLQSMRAALELAHQENLTEVAFELEQLLRSVATKLSLQNNWLNLEQLVELWTQTKQPQPHDPHTSQHSHLVVSVFWALLLLCAQSKVELLQEEFYQDIKIRLLTDSANGESIDTPVNSECAT